MALDLPATGEPLGAHRCPSCRAAVRADAPWCTQCWQDLRAPVADAEPEPAPVPAVEADETPGWPCACGARTALTEDACPACGTGVFDALRGEGGPLLVVPGLGDVTGLTKPQLAVAAGALLAVLLGVLLAVLALAGALLT